ncbi:MAG: NAD(P)/FAD-dependent oxidoreductase, partial [Inhella sp.]
MKKIPNFSRRQLLGSGAALALAGCASAPPPTPSIGRVVVVGGGFGGATCAHYLKMWGGNVDVTLVERNAAFISCPISNLVIGGFRAMSDITRGYDTLRAAGVKVVQDEVLAIDPIKKTVRLKGGSPLSYDRLVVSPGVDFMFEQVGGLERELNAGRVAHAWKAGPQTELLRRQLESMPDGGVVAMTIPKAPYRCPPGPYERACMVAAYLKQAKPKAKLLVLDANPEVQSKKALFEKAFKDHYSGVLEYRANAELKEVAGKVAKLEFEDVKADVLNVIPPQRAADLAKSSGLITVNQRWCGVNWLSMESTAVPNVHVLGDAVFAAPLMPKSGHMANQHAKLAAAAILELLQGGQPNPSPVL